ncbi:MAG: hypothetical protein KJN92_06550, partial [Gemmatimonadetes bacterium]|nr:hypothetical protein [Gemmatimonadota bacterium]
MATVEPGFRVIRKANPIIQAFLSSRTIKELLGTLPKPGETLTVGGCLGSGGSAAVAAVHEASENRVLVGLTSSPIEATSVAADLEALLGKGTSFLYPQRESLPYEATEPHLEVGGLRVEALEALFGGRTRLLVTTARALQE